MSTASIFVSYPLTGDKQGAAVARRLIDDLRSNGAEVITDDETIANEDYIRYLEQKLPLCHFLIMIQTRPSLKSLRVQMAVTIALNMVAQQRMKGVWRVLADPIGSVEDQPSWVTPRTFDASQDYPRARDKVLLELGLLAFDDEVSGFPKQTFSLAPPRPLEQKKALPIELQSVAPVADLRPPVLRDHPQTVPLCSRSQRLFLGGIALVLMLALILGVTLFRGRAAAHGGASASVHLAASSVGTPLPTNAPPVVGTISLVHTPTPTRVPTQAPTQVSTPSHSPQVIVDNLNDWSKVYSHTPNLSFDRNNSQWMHGDTSLLVRDTDTNENAVWKLAHLTSFQAAVYFWPTQSNDPLEDMTVYTSADGVHWTSVHPAVDNIGGNWVKLIYTLNNLKNVNFVKMRWGTTGEDKIWAQQIGQVILKSS